MRIFALVELLVGLLCLPTGAASAAAMRCDVVVRSLRGGELDVVTGVKFPLVPNIIPEPQVAWHPPSSDRRVDLVVGYKESTLYSLKTVDGGHLRVRGLGSADGVSVSFRRGNKLLWMVPNASIVAGTDELGQPATDVGFDSTEVGPGQLIRAINTGEEIDVTVDFRSHEYLKSKFVFGYTHARDRLLARARNKIRSLDRRYCTDREPPVVIGG